MNALADLVQRRRRGEVRNLAVLDGGLAGRIWLRQLLAAADLAVVVAAELPMERALRSAGDGAVRLALVDGGTRSGIGLWDLIEDRVMRVRTLAPDVGVAVVTAGAFNPRLLPPRTWIISPASDPDDVAAMVATVQDAQRDRNPLRREWPPASRTGRSSPAAAPILGGTPNFNIRHPGMLVPIARVGAALDAPVYCELSPQEALVHYSRGAGDRVRAALTELRTCADLVAGATGCDLRLHLDHCDDPGILVHALDVGFDSIMADGSDLPLRMNIRFTRHAVERARDVGVPVEGEVGSIDPEGKRRTSRSEPADVTAFLAETGVAFLGVNIGQVHGTDYGFGRSLRDLRLLAELERAHRGDDARSFSDACAELDSELAAHRHRSHRDPERACIRRMHERLIAGPPASVESLLAEAYDALPLASWPVLGTLERRWHERRAARAGERTDIRNRLLGAGAAARTDGPRLLDFDLLRSVSAATAAAGARVVVHGGSSVDRDDLRYLSRLGVARVNFGSRPFNAFVQAVASTLPGVQVSGRDAVAFLAEQAADWRDWLERPPLFLESFEEELRRSYFHPLRGGGEAVW